MRKTIAALAVFGGVMLSGCATTGVSVDPTTGQVTDPQLSAAYQTIVADVKLACSYIVPLSDVVAVVSTIVPNAQIVQQVTSQICKAVTSLGVRQGGVAANVNGIVLHGHFAAGARHLRAR